MNKYREFSSYNGLDRTVLFMGIPMAWAMILLVLSIFTMLIGMVLYKFIGLLFPLVWLPVALFLRIISQTDDKALGILGLELRFRMKRKAYKEFGNTLTFLPEHYLRYKKQIEPTFTNYNEVSQTSSIVKR